MKLINLKDKLVERNLTIAEFTRLMAKYGVKENTASRWVYRRNLPRKSEDFIALAKVLRCSTSKLIQKEL